MVVALEQGYAWIEARRQSACAACAADKGCGTAVLARVLGQRSVRVRALNTLVLEPGDEVVVGLKEGALLRGSLLVYLLPLVTMLCAAAYGDNQFPQQEALSIVLGGAGLLAGFAGLYWRSREIRDDARYQPIVLRRIDTALPSPDPHLRPLTNREG